MTGALEVGADGRETVASMEARAAIRDDVRGWWVCECGRTLDKHGKRKVPNAGMDEYVCADAASGRFTSSLPGYEFEPGKGLSRKKEPGG